MSSKRRSTGASEVAPSEAESTSGRKRKASHTAPAPIKLPRLEFVAELEEKYSSLAKKAVAAAEKAAKGSSTATSKQQLQAVFEDVKTAAFGLLRAHCERADVADEEETEELDRDLAREVDRLRKKEDALARAVKEAREKNRATLPGQMKAAYDARLAALTADDDDDADMEEDEDGAAGGVERRSGGGGGVEASSSRTSASAADRRKKSKGGRQSLLSMLEPSVSVAAADLSQRLKVLKDTAADVSERAHAGKRALPTLTQDVQDGIAVRGKVVKKSATDVAIASAATVPTPGKRRKA